MSPHCKFQDMKLAEETLVQVSDVNKRDDNVMLAFFSQITVTKLRKLHLE
jgi:hypothetical protein